MTSYGIQKLKCEKDGHQDEIESVCYNEICSEIRLNCFKCMKKGIHHAHLDDVEKTNSLIEFIENKNKECDNFINDLTILVQSVTQSFYQFKKGVKYKYQLQKERLIQLNSLQINDLLNSTIKFTEEKQSITKIISDQIKKLNHIFNNLYDQLNLSLFNYYYINDIDIKLSKEKYNQGNCNHIFRSHVKSQNIQFQIIYQDHKYDVSIELLDKSIQLDPTNYQTLWCKGDCLRMLGRYEDSIAWLDKALNANSKHVNSLFNKGDCLRMLGRYEDAIVWLDKALTIDYKNVNSLYSKGDCLRLLNRYEDAITWLDKALTIDSNHINSLFNKGECLRLMKRFNDSLKYLDQALQIDPNHTPSLQSKGSLLENQEKYYEALIYYEKQLKILPNDQWTINRKAICQCKLKQ